MNDLTIIMLTPNKVPEQWAEYHKQVLLEAADGLPIITISSKPLDWGINLIQTGYSLTNLFRQILRGSELATTHWIAIAEDDTLYPKDHFAFRPKTDGYHYNLNRWVMATWLDPPFYFYKPKPANGMMIATRELVIQALTDRLSILTEELESSHWWLRKELGNSNGSEQHDKVRFQPFYTRIPIVGFYHDFSVDDLSRRHKKYIYPVSAYDLPKWRKAEDIREKFK